MKSTNGSPSSGVTFRFKKIGPIDEAEMELGDLTLIAGRNNTGKTYLVYTLYGLLKLWRRGWPQLESILKATKVAESGSTLRPPVLDRIAAQVLDSGQVKYAMDLATLSRERTEVIQAVAREYVETALDDVFSSPRKYFAESSLIVDLSNVFSHGQETLRSTTLTGEVLEFLYDGHHIVATSNWNEEERPGEYSTSRVLDVLTSFREFIFPELALEPFVLSAERFGISLFYKELDFTKNRLVDLLQQMGDEKDRERFSPFFLIDQATSRYALPIKDNIDYTRSIGDLQKDRSELHEDKLFDDIKDMMDGYYRSENDDIQFRSKARRDRSFAIPLHRASSSARGLSDLYFFLRHVARKDHLLIIDEPESHLDTAQSDSACPAAGTLCTHRTKGADNHA